MDWIRYKDNNNNIMLNLMLFLFEKCSTNIKLYIKCYESVQFPTLKTSKFHVQFCSTYNGAIYLSYKSKLHEIDIAELLALYQ